MKKLLCLFGIHHWEQSRALGLHDGFPFFGEPYDNPVRECQRCGTSQRWLPGYGGSEWGSWETRDA